MTPSLGSVYLLEQLMELREIVWLIIYQITMKGYNSGRARQKRRIGKVWGRAWSSHVLFRHHSPQFPYDHPPGHSPNFVLLGFYGAFIT